MKGLELCRRYYYEAGRPALTEKFPEVMARAAAGLAGDGSECLGYDDEISRDHDFGPGFCLWLTEEDYVKYGAGLKEAYQSLPREFLGFLREETPQAAGRVGVMEIHSFYSRFIGSEQPPKSLLRWLYLPEDRLCQACSGEVFEDPLGIFSEIREGLLRYYPEDVRIKKIAACLARMAQSGQYNYGRLMLRGDTVAAGFALQEFIRNTLGILWLFNRRYAPYYKWSWHGLNELKKQGKMDTLPEVLPLLRELSVTGDQSEAWAEIRKKPVPGLIFRKDRKVELIEEICGLTASCLRADGLSDCRDSFLQPHAFSVMARIRDTELARCHVMEG